MIWPDEFGITKNALRPFREQDALLEAVLAEIVRQREARVEGSDAHLPTRFLARAAGKKKKNFVVRNTQRELDESNLRFGRYMRQIAALLQDGERREGS